MTKTQLKKLANDGDPHAQYLYGLCLFEGCNCKKNEELGEFYLKEAMANGSKEAKEYLEYYFFDDNASTQGES